MSLVVDKKIETIEVPSDYKNLFLRIIEKFSANEVENKIFFKKNNENIISEKIKEINKKEEEGKIKFVSFEEGEKQGENFLKTLFSN